MLDSIPEAGNLQNAKRTCCNHDNSMSVASGDNSVSAGNQFTKGTKLAPQVLQQHQAALNPQILDAQVQTSLQWQVAHQQAMQQQQAVKQQHTIQ
eukprot:1465932-Ditylum_brightwellii.AAC.1